MGLVLRFRTRQIPTAVQAPPSNLVVSGRHSCRGALFWCLSFKERDQPGLQQVLPAWPLTYLSWYYMSRTEVDLHGRQVNVEMPALRWHSGSILPALCRQNDRLPAFCRQSACLDRRQIQLFGI